MIIRPPISLSRWTGASLVALALLTGCVGGGGTLTAADLEKRLADDQGQARFGYTTSDVHCTSNAAPWDFDCTFLHAQEGGAPELEHRAYLVSGDEISCKSGVDQIDEFHEPPELECRGEW